MQYVLKDSENNLFLLSRTTGIHVVETNTVNFESKIFFQGDWCPYLRKLCRKLKQK